LKIILNQAEYQNHMKLKKTINKKIRLNGFDVNYSIRKNRRARRLKLAVYCDGSVVATIPRWIDAPFIERIIIEKAKWILEKIEKFKKSGNRKILLGGNTKEYKAKKEEARKLVIEKVDYFNQFYKFNFNRIAIRNQRTRWGSCSKNGNLNFNYRIIHLPEKLVNYLVVHELCHLKEFNHSPRFWDLVGQAIPDYKKLKREIRAI
jgi:predicted metal-dependent hydrolase